MFKQILIALALSCAAGAFAAVDVNQASVAELDGIKGIGPAMSSRILDERKKGPFKDWGDLMARVKGVGQASAARLSAEGLTVGGASFRIGVPATDAKTGTAPKN
ncbi:helix-hairpin-helix domain-containing protein [Comamonadaceae bacterium G21597-S1]|nr:helix-hairpin-helix domain-containing protein [Comamonadaceae bacterium G21597-S1]